MTKKPPNIFIAARSIATSPKILDNSKLTSNVILDVAIIAGLSGDIKSIFDTSNIFGFLAIFLAAINIFGGFLVTQRMLQMYKKKKKNK